MTGEFECKADTKGRIRLPVGLLHQMVRTNLSFMVNRGFEKHLIIYPRKVWEQKTEEMGRLSLYKKNERRLVRYFYRGASELTLDNADRVLIPKSLLEFAGIKKELVLFAYRDQIEVWSKERYDTMIEEEPEDFSAIADELFGNSASEEI